MADGVFRAPLVLNQQVFLYGTLCDPDLLDIVAGTALDAEPAELADAAVCWVAGESFPVLRASVGDTATGILVTVGPEARARMDFYELGFGYGVEQRLITTRDGEVRAFVYSPAEGRLPGAPWSLSDWQKEHGALARMAATELMRLMATHTPDAAARAYPQIRMRAASKLRAGNAPSPEPFEPKMAHRAVSPQRTAQPYADYFAVREDWLSFPTFDGGDSAVVKRASFLGGDAVTVLPYDPVTDHVLMIRQFRHGAFARGDSNPWTLEPAAGRIDPNEDPEETAARELFEETGVTAEALHFVGRYYPSPGAYSEYLYSYVGTADLVGTDGGIGGLQDEAEDILRHRVPFDQALAMVHTGAINTGPLILSLFWLAGNRKKLAGR